jgi:hypothetical protein
MVGKVKLVTHGARALAMLAGHSNINLKAEREQLKDMFFMKP